MNNVVTIQAWTAADSKSDHSSSYKELRRNANLTLVQAAEALGLSPRTVESWEHGTRRGRALDEVKEKYAQFSAQAQERRCGNLMFGVYSVRLARQILNLPVEDIAARYGVSKPAWLRLEADTRAINPDLLRRIESDVRKKFMENCGLACEGQAEALK